VKKPLRIGYLLDEFPALSQTFVLRELEELERQGVEITIFAIRQPAGKIHDSAQKFLDRAHYAPPLFSWETARAILRARFGRPWRFQVMVTRLAWAGFMHPRIFWQVRHARIFWQARHLVPHACWMAREMEKLRITHLHAHFASLPTTLALMVSYLLRIPFSFSAHARDIYYRPLLLKEKIRRARFVVTCTRANLKHLQQIAGPALSRKIHLIYHGLPLTEFAPTRAKPEPGLPTILAVGRLVEKKGFSVLIQACRILQDRGIAFDCLLIGEGLERPRLERLIADLNLRYRVQILGAMTQTELLPYFRQADVLVCPSVIDRDGDRDGLPNVLLEALAMKVPVVATSVGGIPELIEHEETGLLCPPGDPQALANALERVIQDRALADSLTEKGRQRVVAKFDVRANVKQLAQLLLGK